MRRTFVRRRLRRPVARLLVAASAVGALVAPATAGAWERPWPSEGVVLVDPARGAPEVAEWPPAPPATAQAYLLVDADTGQVLAARAADERRPVASTVKILTVLTALEYLELDQQVEVGQEVVVGGAGVGLDPGETWTVQQLVDAIFVRSGNDAALALATAATGDLDRFATAMREVAADLGIDGAQLYEPTGLDDTNRLSARDLAVASAVALNDPALRPSLGLPRVALPDLGVVEARNLLLVEGFPGATGLKTGFTELAGYTLVASASRDGRELIAVVLGARGDHDRFAEAAALLEHGFGAFTAVDLDGGWQVRVAGGWVPRPSPIPRVWAPAGKAPLLDVTVPSKPDGELVATVSSAGDRIGRVSAGDGTAPEAAGGGGGVGARLADALYTAMREGHRQGLWTTGDGSNAA